MTITSPSSASSPTDVDGPYLQVEDLTVTFPTQDGPVQAVKGLSYSVELGKTLGIVGESGSGKSVSSMAVMGLHDAKSSEISGSIRVGGTEVVGLAESRMRKLRGNAMAMIFQDALAALHPFYRVGDQLAEAYCDAPPEGVQARRAVARRSRCSTASASRSPTAASTTSPTSSPAACASA